MCAARVSSHIPWVPAVVLHSALTGWGRDVCRFCFPCGVGQSLHTTQIGTASLTSGDAMGAAISSNVPELFGQAAQHLGDFNATMTGGVGQGWGFTLQCNGEVLFTYGGGGGGGYGPGDGFGMGGGGGCQTITGVRASALRVVCLNTVHCRAGGSCVCVLVRGCSVSRLTVRRWLFHVLVLAVVRLVVVCDCAVFFECICM